MDFVHQVRFKVIKIFQLIHLVGILLASGTVATQARNLSN